jgi:general secretion pathway protein M
MSYRSPTRVLWLQAATLIALLIPVIVAAIYVGGHHQRVFGLLADLEPRYARLTGLVQYKAELEALNVKVTEQLERLTYPSAQDVTQTGNSAQQRIRGLFVDSNLNVISIQVLPAVKDDSKFDKIPISLRVEGDLAGIQSALTKLSNQTPLILVESLSVQTIGAVKPASIQHLSGQFGLLVLRVKP